jgi:hypothetical protein
MIRKTTILLAILAVSVMTSSAMAQASSTRVPFTQFQFVPCADEFVEISGTLHIVSRTTVDNAGGVHVKIQSQPQGATGVGTISGDVYHGGGVTQLILNTNSGGLPFSGTFVNSFTLVGRGPVPDLHVHQTIHLTINEKGAITADISETRITCD